MGRVILLAGRVNAVVEPHEADYNPSSDYCTVPVDPAQGRVHYLKFKTAQEMESRGLVRNDQIEAEGCLHLVNDYPLIFAVSDIGVKFRPECTYLVRWWTDRSNGEPIYIGAVAFRQGATYCFYIGASFSVDEERDAERIAKEGAILNRDVAVAILGKPLLRWESGGLEYRVPGT